MRDLANENRYEVVIGSVMRSSRSSSWKVTGRPFSLVVIAGIMSDVIRFVKELFCRIEKGSFICGLLV